MKNHNMIKAAFITAVLIAALTGCSGKATETQTEIKTAEAAATEAPKTEAAPETQAETKTAETAAEAPKTAKAPESEAAFETAAITETVKTKETALGEEITGTYLYRGNSEEDSTTFEISLIDGKLFIEYTGEYSYGMAELEPLDDNPMERDGKRGYKVCIYPFSGFAFAGDYWGAGSVCDLMIEENGLLLKNGQPFLSGQVLFLERIKFIDPVPGILLNKTENKSAPKLVGAWRCESESNSWDDDSVFEIYAEFKEDGEFNALKKAEGYPPELYRGIYFVQESGAVISGEIYSIHSGYNALSDEWDFSLDTASDKIVIHNTYTGTEPFTWKEGTDLPYVRTEPGKWINTIKPGPGSRTEEVVDAWNAFLGNDEVVLYDYNPDYIDFIVEKAKELTGAPEAEVVSIAPDSEGGFMTIRCYETVKNDGETRTVTWNWVYYGFGTGVYTDFFGDTL